MVERVKIAFKKKAEVKPVYTTLALPLTFALSPARTSRLYSSPDAHAEGLPERCAAYHPMFENPIMLVPGVPGYYELADREFNVEEYNRLRNVSAAQLQAMLVGALQGWGKPEADPAWHENQNRIAREATLMKFKRR